MKKYYIIVSLCIVFFSCGKADKDTGKIRIAVSILPQKYFVEKIGGARVSVSVMVEPGQSPETYEPTPQQMVSLHNAKILFILGVPFENAWVNRVKMQNPGLEIIDTSAGIERRSMETPALILGEIGNHDDHDHHGTKDPHLWLDPLRVIQMTNQIHEALIKADSEGTENYTKGRDGLVAELGNLDGTIRKILSPLEARELFVFHPAWGYFADRYGLTQFPVEVEGREPGPRELARISDAVRGKKIKAILVQKQFDTRMAEIIGKNLGIAVVTADPLAENYCANLEDVARLIAGEKK